MDRILRFRWIFIYWKKNLTLQNFLFDKKFSKCQSIYFNWVIFNDNDLIRFDNRSLNKRFLHPSLNFTQGKSFIRGKIKNLIISSSYIPGINIFNFCNSNGELISQKNFISNIFEREPKAYIKHFYTKAAEEFCNKIKIKKGHAHFHKKHRKYLKSIKNENKIIFPDK